MSNDSKSLPVIAKKLGGALDAVYRRTHAATALLAAAIADQQLRDALLTKMRKLPRAQEEELFKGYGPLSSFSAKIAMAFAFELMTTKLELA